LRPEQQCLGLILTPPDGDSNAECRPVDIQLYTWRGPGFESGECWHQGQRFINGATWGRTDIPGAPYCVCEQGKVRIFYSQHRPEEPSTHLADSLTLLRPFHGSSPTPNDLAKWPIPNVITVRQRSVVCTTDRLGMRVRSRDSCTGCKCSKNGHWLCRKPPILKGNRTKNIHHRRTSRSLATTSRNLHYPWKHPSPSINIERRASTVRIRPQCPSGTIPQYCILIERIVSSNSSEKSSRYIEIPRETSWIDQQRCTQCSCTLDGRLFCEFLHSTCNRSCLIEKTQPIPLMYYFPPGAKWVTPPHDKCRSCMCVRGERKCINCDQILKINVENSAPQRSPIGEFRLGSPISTSSKQIKPCVLQISTNSHRLLLPSQRTWFQERCFVCSKQHGRLVSC
ncbi:unnamed protein product, partial [Adineta ricciae]